MLIGVGFVAAGPSEIFKGLEVIVLSSDILITDYIELAGVGPAFVNVGLVVVITNMLMYANKMPIKSGNIVTIGLMSGFAFLEHTFSVPLEKSLCLNIFYRAFGRRLLDLLSVQPFSIREI